MKAETEIRQMKTEQEIRQMFFNTEQAIINTPHKHKKKHREYKIQLQVLRWVLTPSKPPKKVIPMAADKEDKSPTEKVDDKVVSKVFKQEKKE